jgi:methyltransferase
VTGRRYLALLAASAGLRLAELALSARNLRRARGVAAGGAGDFALMVACHLALFAAPPLEVALRRPRPRATPVWVAVLAGAAALRWWVIASLGPRWNVRAAVPTRFTPVTGGPYRFVRHPNYLAVAAEFLALPLAGGAWRSALALSALDAVVLARRVRAEERLLSRSRAWRRAFRRRPRLIPGVI